MNYGYIRVAAAIPEVKVADVDFNIKEIMQCICDAEKQGVEIIVFPELSITGYTCQDLFRNKQLLVKSDEALAKCVSFTKNKSIISIIGIPVLHGCSIYDCAVVVYNGKIVGAVAKSILSDKHGRSEKRWFSTLQGKQHIDLLLANQEVRIYSSPTLFRIDANLSFGIEIGNELFAPIPQSTTLSLAGATIVVNPAAPAETMYSTSTLIEHLSNLTRTQNSAYVYSGAGFGESTQDQVFGAAGFIFENGTLLKQSERFSFKSQLIISDIDGHLLQASRITNSDLFEQKNKLESPVDVIDVITDKIQNTQSHCNTQDTPVNTNQLYRKINPYPFLPKSGAENVTCENILDILVMALAKRFLHIHAKTIVIGVSGGLDSTLALLVAARMCDKLNISRKTIIAITMPGFGTSGRTHTNAHGMMEQLDVTLREISIHDAVKQHFKDIGHDENIHDATFENAQARERTQILMDIANQTNGLVLGTGDMSELALGWATYNGDHMSMYGINAGIPKTLIRCLVSYCAKTSTNTELASILSDVVNTPISPELLPSDSDEKIEQKTEDIVGPYELHDFFLYYVLRYGFSVDKIRYMATSAFSGIYSEGEVSRWLQVFYKRFVTQQFKRSCMPDGPQVCSVSLSPRGGWLMPSDAVGTIWTER